MDIVFVIYLSVELRASKIQEQVSIMKRNDRDTKKIGLTH